MARRRRRSDEGAEGTTEAPEAAPAPSAPAVETATEPTEAEPQVDVRMRGTAEAVASRLSKKRPEAASRPKDDDNDSEKKRFISSLRNSRYTFRVKRVYPPKVGDVVTAVEVFNSECPTTLQEIINHVTQEAKGGKYKVYVMSAENEMVAADTFTVPGEPFIKESAISEEENQRLFMEDRPKDMAELSEESLERQGRLATRQLELERIQQQLEDAREARKSSKRPGELDPRIERLERQLIESRHQAEIERIQRESDRKIDELKALISKSAQPVQPQGSSEISLIVRQMQSMQEANDRRMADMLKAMQDDKMSALMREVQAIKSRPAAEGGGMVEAMKSFMMMAKMMGLDLPGQDDDDDDDDSDKPWYERLADKYLPKLLDVFDEKAKKGEKVSREDFMAEMNKMAKQAEDEAVARATQRILPPPPTQRPALPPPPPPAGEAAPAPAPVPAAPAPAALPEPPMDVERQMALRAIGVLTIFANEIEMRPNEQTWNYDGAWRALPEPILEKVCAASDAIGIVDALIVPGVDTVQVDLLKAKITANPRMQQWAMRGLLELKEWWAEKLKDPNFEPLDDEDGGEEDTDA